MGRRAPRAPLLALFWLLLLLPPQLLSAGGGPRLFRGARSALLKKGEKKEGCNSDFDLYFILDKSGSVNNNWLDIYNWVEDLVKKFQNPKLRISFILYSDHGTTLMPITSDRKKITEGLKELKAVVPLGATYMDKGFQKANEQMEQATAGGKKVSSMIIAFTDGTLEPPVFANTKAEARKSRHMGATVYAVGVKDFVQSQLEEVADTKEHAFGVLGGFQALQSITDKLAEKSCIELKSLDPVVACVGGGEYRVVVRGSGFQNTRDKGSVICRFKFSDNTFADETAIAVEEKFIICPGTEVDEPGEDVFVEISLNKGNNFFANNLKYKSVLCGEGPTAPVRSTSHKLPAKPAPETTTTETTTTETTTTETTPAAPAKPRKFPLIPVVVSMSSLTVPLLLCCICYLCKPTKKPRPPQPPPPKKVCRPLCPLLIAPCCACPGSGRLSQMEGKLDLLCALVNESCSSMRLMRPSLGNMGRCLTFTPMRTSCLPVVSDPSLCTPPCRERVPFPMCPECCHSPSTYSQSSRMLPLVPPCARALARCPPQALPPKPQD